MAITVADIFPFSMDDNERGLTIERNLSSLTAELSAEGETIALKDGDAADIFGANDVICNQEDMLVGAVNAITREQNGTTGVIHRVGAVVRLKGGTTIATFTSITGTEAITGIRMTGNAPAMFQVKINSVFGPPFFTGGLGQEQFFPFSGITPVIGDTIELVGWTNQASADFWVYSHI